MPADTPEKTQQDEPVDASQTSTDDSGHETPDVDVDPVTALEQERDQFRDQFLRMAAEMDNFRKRVNREREEDRKYASFGLISELLPAMDNLQRAIDTSAEDEGAKNVLVGVKMVLKQFEDILARNGAEEIAAQGEPFDPNLHEALQQQPNPDVPPMTVIQVLERGFKLRDRVLRPAKVIVSSEV